jgi:hypothetical protein
MRDYYMVGKGKNQESGWSFGREALGEAAFKAEGRRKRG